MTLTTETPGTLPPGESGAADVVTGEGSAPVALALSTPTPSRLSLLVKERSDELRADREWSMRLYELFARGGMDERMHYLVLDGDPWSKSRPRFTRRGRTYQPRDDRDAEQRLADRLRAARDEMFTGNVMLACRFYRSTYQRIDTDNLLKHVCDSANGVWWADDSQVTFVLGEIHYDREHPRTIIMAANHFSTLPRGSDRHRECESCGEEFLPTPRAGALTGVRFCSARCSARASGRPDLSQPVPCAGCSTDFRRKTSAQKFCSTGCARVAARDRPKGSNRRTSRCAQCGVPLAHNRGGRCRTCWQAYPKGQPAPVQAEMEIEP